MADGDENREQGVEFGELGEKLDGEEYPLTKDELVEKYGDYELELEEGEATVEEILAPQGEATYDSGEGARRGILNMVGSDALGRDRYSDRGVQSEDDDAGESV